MLSLTLDASDLGCARVIAAFMLEQSLCGVEDWAYQTEASLRHLAESLGSLTEWLASTSAPE